MENQKSSSKSIMLNYGVLLGLITILMNVSLFVMGNLYDPHWSFMVIGIIASIALIIMGIKKYKSNNNGFIKLGQALKIGLGIALISGVIGVVYTLIFANFIEPDHYQLIVDTQIDKAVEMKPDMSEDEIDATRKIYEVMSGPTISSALGIAASLFFGFIVSLIGGLIMKKSNEEITSI